MSETIALFCSGAVVLLAVVVIICGQYGDALMEMIDSMCDDDGEML